MSAVGAYHNFRQATGEAVTEESQRADAAIAELEAELAQRDRMLQLAYEMEELPAEWDPEGYAAWYADLRDDAEEGRE